MRDQSTNPENEVNQPAGETMEDLRNWLKKQPPSGRTEEDFEAQINEERDAWGD